MHTGGGDLVALRKFLCDFSEDCQKPEFRPKELAGTLVCHFTTVRKKILAGTVFDASVSKEFLSDYRSVHKGGSDDRLFTLLSQRAADTPADLLYLCLLDTMLSDAAGEECARWLRLVHDRATSLWVKLRQLTHRVRLFLAVARLLCSVVMREADAARARHRPKGANHNGDCSCSSTEVFQRSISQTSLEVVTTALRRGFISHPQFRRTAEDAVQAAIRAWWTGDVDAIGYMHIVSRLYVDVFSPLSASDDLRGIIIQSLTGEIASFTLQITSVCSVAEVVVAYARKLGSTGVVAAAITSRCDVNVLKEGGGDASCRSGLLSWMPPQWVEDVKDLCFRCLSEPLRGSIASLISQSVDTNDSVVLQSALTLESLKNGDASKDHTGCIASLWITEQIRSGLSASLRRVMAHSLGIDEEVFQDPRWCLLTASPSSKNVVMTRELFLASSRGLCRWIGERETLLTLAMRQSGGTFMLSIAQRYVNDLLSACGKSLFASGSSWMAAMISVALQSGIASDHHQGDTAATASTSRGGSSASGVVTERDILRLLEVVVSWIRDLDTFVDEFGFRLERRVLDQLPLSSSALEREQAVFKVMKHLTSANRNELRRIDVILRDLEQQKDVNQSLHLETIAAKVAKDTMSPAPLELTVVVLQSYSWHTVSATVTRLRYLPIEINVTMKLLEERYLNKWPNRRLHWSHAASTCSAIILYANSKSSAPSRVEITVSLLGACILSYFDLVNSDVLSVSELKDVVIKPVKHNEKQVVRYDEGVKDVELFIQRMVAMKIFLQKSSDASPPSVSVNRDFVSRIRKLNAIAKLRRAAGEGPTPAASPTTSGTSSCPQIHGGDMAKRRWEPLKAAIVRIMKARRVLDHQSLFDATVKQLETRFHPTMSVFKDVVASLIETNYLERQEEMQNSYVYVA